MSRVTKTVQEAKDQAAEYFGFAASTYIQTDDGKVWEIPNPGLMNDDQQERWEDLQYELQSFDRDEDLVFPEHKLEDGTVVPERRIEGDLLVPYRKNGERMKPSYNIRLAKVLFGEDGYEEYKAAGGIANQIALEWARMNAEYQARVKTDPKSDGSRPTLEAVPERD